MAELGSALMQANSVQIVLVNCEIGFFDPFCDVHAFDRVSDHALDFAIVSLEPLEADDEYVVGLGDLFLFLSAPVALALAAFPTVLEGFRLLHHVEAVVEGEGFARQVELFIDDF